MRAYVLRGAWLGSVLGASVWAAGCGSSEHSTNPGNHHPATAGASSAGTGGSASGGRAGSGTAGSGQSGSATAGSSAGGSAGALATGGTGLGTSGEGGESGNAGAAASAGDSALGGAGSGSGGTHAGGTGGASMAGEAGMGEGGGGDTGPLHADKLDLLFVVDNSISMYEKQSVLSATIPKFVARLVDPWCVGSGMAPVPAVNGACASGLHRELEPVQDMHVGVITTSLGDHGSNDVCSAAQSAANVQAGGNASDYDDHGRLLPSMRSGLPSWNASGFLNWDPQGKSSPVGQSDVAAFAADVRTTIEAAGAIGCGYESTLEATYRFLVDPEPPLAITNNGSVTVVATDASNIDQDVLDQRAAFLRPDSAVVIVSLSDEDDCSINDSAGNQGWLVSYKGGVGQGSWHMPRASAACADDPNDECCRPCSTTAPTDCPDNATDTACSLGTTLTYTDDNPNLRCFHQQQRFGINLLYPLARYTAGLSSASVPKRSGGTAPNPLLANGRNARLVIYAPIVGVPWQDLAEDPNDTDSLTLMTARELRDHGRWPVLVGDYASFVPPSDPFMQDSIDQRSGTNPVTGAAIVTSTSADPLGTINGHESTVPSTRDDLQYACIFPLPAPVVCDSTNEDGCDCNTDEVDRNHAICQPPGGGATGTTQYFGKAYPGLRHLELARQLGDRAVVSSICARNTTSSSRDDYGYVPTMRAIQTHLSALLGQ